MDSRTRVLMAKAFGYTRALSNLDKDERGLQATESLANDYNRFVDEVERVAPLFDLPPKLTVIDYGANNKRSRETLYELYIFCEQIYQMLALLDDEETTAP